MALSWACDHMCHGLPVTYNRRNFAKTTATPREHPRYRFGQTVLCQQFDPATDGQQFMPEIYLDNNATTHLASSVRDALRAAIEQDFGNPSSAHRAGEKARRAIVEARDAVSALLGASADDLLFGSGATELNYWVLTHALRQSKRPHLITTEVEHSCVLETATSLEATGVRVTRLTVEHDGRINIGTLKSESGYVWSLGV